MGKASASAMRWAGIWGSPLEAPSPRGGAAGVFAPTSSFSQQQAASCHLLPLPHTTSALPTLPPASREVRKPRAVETSWVSRHLCQAPVPTWAHHQCPVGEGKGGAPAKPETPSLNPAGPLCPPSRLPPWTGNATTTSTPVPISGVRVRERRRRREARSRGGDREEGELWGPADGSLTGGRGGSGRGGE